MRHLSSITLWGPLARIAICVLAVFGFVLALGDVLDLYGAYWWITAPATLVYVVVLWRYALVPAKGAPPPTPVWPLGLDIVLTKALMTLALVMLTLGAVALAWDLIKLGAQYWPYLVLSLLILAAICVWSLIPGKAERAKRRAARAARIVDPGGSARDELIS